MIGSAAQNIIALIDSVFLYHYAELEFATIGKPEHVCEVHRVNFDTQTQVHATACVSHFVMEIACTVIPVASSMFDKECKKE